MTVRGRVHPAAERGKLRRVSATAFGARTGAAWGAGSGEMATERLYVHPVFMASAAATACQGVRHERRPRVMPNRLRSKAEEVPERDPLSSTTRRHGRAATQAVAAGHRRDDHDGDALNDASEQGGVKHPRHSAGRNLAPETVQARHAIP